MYEFDPYDDNRNHLNKLASAVKGRLLKSAEDLTERRKYLADTEFALVLVDPEDTVKFRKFACTDSGNVAQSVYYFLNRIHEIPKEAIKTAAENLLRCSLDWDLTPPPELVKLAGSKDPWPDTNMVVLKKLKPVPKIEKTAEEHERDKVEEAIENFNKFHKLMSPWEKRAMAKKLYPLLKKGGKPIPERIDKYAGDSYCPYLPTAISFRCSLCAPKDYSNEAMERATLHKRAYVNLLQDKDTLTTEEFARDLHFLDKSAGITELQNVPDAVYATFQKKSAEEKEKNELVHSDQGVNIYEQELAAFVIDKYLDITKLLGEDVASALRDKPKVVFNTLPLPQKKLLTRLFSQTSGN